MRLFGGERMHLIASNLGMSDDDCLDFRAFSGIIESSQKKVEDLNFKRRKNVLAYDDVMNKQRELIYKQRQDVLNGMDISQKIANMIAETVQQKVADCYNEDTKEFDLKGFETYFVPLLREKYPLVEIREMVSKNKVDVDKITELLCEKANAIYKEKEEIFGADNMREIERAVLLRNVDTKWMDHIDAMSELRNGIGLRAYGQHDPVIEYKREGFDMFDAMVDSIREDTVRMIFLVQLRSKEEPKREKVANETGASGSDDGTLKKEPVRVGKKIGRNDPCPCGSGLKYKKCCGKDQ
jgi:preprotein translocase subunit SecA